MNIIGCDFHTRYQPGLSVLCDPKLVFGSPGCFC